jgi:signal transduction histidine kinase/ligand-binding sensor domain-containing protein
VPNPADPADLRGYSARWTGGREANVDHTDHRPIWQIRLILVAVLRTLRENSCGAKCNCYPKSACSVADTRKIPVRWTVKTVTASAIILAVVGAIFCSSAIALAPNRRISQYAHTAWRIQDGFFSGTPQAITQTADGYLWIGTEAGLVRFDGIQFVPWTPPNGEALPSSRIHSLLGTSDGSLWIGTARGLARWSEGELFTFPGEPAFVETIIQNSEGTVWMTRSQVRDAEGALCEVAGNALRCHGTAEGIPFAYAQPLFNDVHGNFWIGSSVGVCRWKSGAAKMYIVKALMRVQGLAGVSAIAPGNDDSVLVGMRQQGKGLGLQELREGVWRDYILPGFDGPEMHVSTLLRDHEGDLWIGTANDGLYRVHAGQADHFSSANGLSSDAVQGFYEDREGDLWVATSRGIDRFHDTRVVSYSIHEGLTSEDVDSVLASHDGTIWIGNLNALDVLRHEKLNGIGPRKGLPGTLITSLFEDRSGRVWVGVDSGLTVYENARFRWVNKPDGSSLGVVTGIVEDVDRNIWVATTQPALFRIQDRVVREEIRPPRIPRVLSLAADPKDGIWLGLSNGNLARYKRGQLEMMTTNRPGSFSVRNLLVDTDGSAWWVSQAGLFRWREGKVGNLNTHNGLPCDDIFALVRDSQGSLWLDTRCGLVAIDSAELERWWRQPDLKLRVKTLDVFDGAQPGLTNFRPEVSRAPDGKLWFANENILQVVDPEHLDGNDIAPPVVVEQIIADRKKYAVSEKLQLPARTRDIEIDYTALSLVVPEKVRFRYKLEGRDADWQDPENRRRAFYSDLPPGSYQFHVIACNNDGVWNEQGANARFTVLPAFYQTAWFRALSVLAGVGVLWLLYALRVRLLSASIQARFDDRLEERERIARDLHDTLLQGIFSASIHLDVANSRLPTDSPARSSVQRGMELLTQVSKEGRNTLLALRAASSQSDLEEALSRLRGEFSLPANVDFRVITEGEAELLRPLIRDEVYLIAREAVINAFRHSKASAIQVKVDYISRNLRVSVRDNGCGIDEELLKSGREGHWGLTNMRERAERIGGRLKVLSRGKAGTVVRLWIPGKLAFERAPSNPFWSWLTRLYPWRSRRIIAKSGEEPPK